MNSTEEKKPDGSVELAEPDRTELKRLCALIVDSWEAVGSYGFMCRDQARVLELLAAIAEVKRAIQRT